jgi:uncharacterized protein CbrC (UPF0167 family)
VTTFADLGTAVPLFAGDIRFAEGLEPAGTCVLCGQRTACLPLDEVVVACAACGVSAPIAARRPGATRDCPGCGARLAVADALDESVRQWVRVRMRGCVPCLRAGRWRQAHETELPDGPEDELPRTPRYATFQGERWLFCHALPMVYQGEWGRADFEAARPGAGRDLFATLMPDDVAAAWELGLADRGGDGDLRMYVFRCQECGALRSHTDTD